MFPNTCDCHFHIFGPYEPFPLAADLAYTPPEASIAAYREIQAALGFTRGVVVQPSVYGTDNTCTLDAVARLGGPDKARAVAVIDVSSDAAQLAELAEAGVRGVRVNAYHGGGSAVGGMAELADRIAPLGWHLQVYLQPAVILEKAALFASLPVPLVVDHLGGIDPTKGIRDPAFVALLKLIEAGNTWVKLSGYLSSAEPPPYADIAPFVRVLAEARPDRLVWGTNWPHPVETPYPPRDPDLLGALGGWLADDAVLRAVLVDNPARLYGFASPD